MPLSDWGILRAKTVLAKGAGVLMLRKLKPGHGLRLVHLAGSLGIGAGCLWLATAHLSPAVWRDVVQELGGLGMVPLALALMCTCASFLAVGRYDAVAHRHFRTGIPGRDACVSGTIAIAIGQTVGLGVVTGALARWRMLPDISFATALRLSAFVCATFMGALAVITATACLLLPSPGFSLLPSLACLALLPVFAILAFMVPVIRVHGLSLRLPSLLALVPILFWTAMDTIAAAAVLYLLLPDHVTTFAALVPIFLLALGAALVSGTPGGIGPFELVLFALLPGGGTAETVSAVIAFRAVYYAGPALLAIMAMARPFAPMMTAAVPDLRPLTTARRAEVGIIRQNGGTLLQTGTTHCAIWTTGQTLCALFDPLVPARSAPCLPLRDAARRLNLWPMIYKCTGRTALGARKQGWHLCHIADEAVLAPHAFNLTSPPYRSLRRKLRAAEHAGVVIRVAGQQGGPLPLAAMAAIDAAWQDHKGPARGGTMGVFTADYVAGQRVFLAYQGSQLVAYASFHSSHAEWCLDLMRQRPDTPDGTMHLLIYHAIMRAADGGIPQLSLAAVPACPDPTSAMSRWIATKVVRNSGGPGLRQFKSSFRPRWQPLYAAAPNAALLALGLADVARAVRWPATVPNHAPPHHDDENYEVASRIAS